MSKCMQFRSAIENCASQHVLQPPIPAFFYAGWQNLREAARGFAGKLDADENLKP